MYAQTLIFDGKVKICKQHALISRRDGVGRETLFGQFLFLNGGKESGGGG